MSADELTPPDQVRAEAHVDLDASPNTLHRNALGLPALSFLCIAAIAPAASALFNIPVMASQAGAATPLVFVLSSVGILCLGIPVVFFSSRLSSAGGFTAWVTHGLGHAAGFQAGWLMLGAYSLFEPALLATVGSSLDSSLSPFFGLHLFGGWMTYALLLAGVVCLLSYIDVKGSLWAMAPFAVAEVVCLLLLDGVITWKGGSAGHDLLHTFSPAGASLKGVAPGGLLGLGVAMVLGLLSFIGFETGAVYGEEARRPHRAIPLALFSLLLFLTVFYTWTSYAATIGVGWQQAGTALGNVNTAPLQYVALANRFVGGWLGDALLVLVVTSNVASAMAMHQATVRYLYAFGREGILPAHLGRTHRRWHSPFIATCAQSLFTVLVLLFLGLILQHTDASGNVTYALGFANGTTFTQTSGVVSFQWLASIVTMCILLVYLLTNLALPFFARSRGELRLLPHICAPLVSSLLLLLPLASYVLPSLPGVGSFFTHLGFAPTPFPSNILPLFVLLWILLGLGYTTYLARTAPQRYRKIGHILRRGQ